MPETTEPPAYTPPQYLLVATGLSQDDLVTQYQEFYHSLHQARATPELVFERLVGNLMSVSSTALSRQRAHQAAAAEAWGVENASLRLGLDSAIVPARNSELDPCSSDDVLSVVQIPQMYVQFMFLAPNHVRATMTNVPIPYGIRDGWTQIDHRITRGLYDSRNDPLITTRTLPTELVRYLHFNSTPESPPQVVVWLTGLSAPTAAGICVAVTARNITATGFELHICSNGGMPIWSVGVAWAIFNPLGEGEYPTLVVETYRSPGRGRTPMFKDGCVMLDRGPASKVEFAAISALDVVLDEKVWVEVKVDMAMPDLRTKSPTVRITAGPVGSNVYSVGTGFYVV